MKRAKEDGDEDDLTDRMWEFAKEKGFDIAEKYGKEIIAKGAEYVGGPVEHIVNIGTHLVDLRSNIKDGDVLGAFSSTVSALKEGAKLHPAIGAYEKAIDIADKGLKAYDLAEKAYNLATD